MNDALEKKLEALPESPGVYLMKDAKGRVIYVGKALSLKHRVRSYFNRTGDGRFFIHLLDRVLQDLEVVLTSTEKEALLLENELIKRHQPRFNVLLRDDKNFICLRLDRSVRYPKLEVQRRMKDDGAAYFGPYASASAIRQTLRLVNRNFHLRSCRDGAFERRMAKRERSSLLCQLNRCPCFTQIEASEYAHAVDEAELFLKGKHTELLEKLRARMKEHAAAMRFEEAGRFRDHVIAVERSLEHQKTIASDFIDRDVFGFAREADRVVLYALFVRNGRLQQGRAFPFAGQEFPDAEVLGSFVSLWYAQGNPVPDEVLIPFALEDGATKQGWLSELRGKPCELLVPQRGNKREWIDMASKNARHTLGESGRSQEERIEALERLQRHLGLQKLPRRIECFDISLFQGTSAVGSCVSFWDGAPDKSRYRRFQVKEVVGTDDFAMMFEVLTRRLKRGLADQDLPDLIVIDGGKGQLASVQAAFRDLGIEGVELCSLAKSRLVDEGDLSRGRGYSGADEAESHRAAFDPDTELARSPERVFLPHRKDPIVLKQNSPELLVLAHARDEAHRFAITYHRSLRKKRTLTTELDAIPGVGETKRKLLLRHFGSVKRVKEAALSALLALDGLGSATAEKVFEHFHGPDSGENA